MDIVEYIYGECARQDATNYGDFAKALSYADRDRRLSGPEHLALVVQGVARFTDPTNTYRAANPGVSNVRTSHVGFLNGGSAAPAGEVHQRFTRWTELAYAALCEFDDTPDEGVVDALIKQLVEVHPWEDGNGRTASIIRNWMLSTLHDPSPLPYFFGDT